MRIHYIAPITAILALFVLLVTGQGYTPWFKPFLNLPASTESLLFAIQAAIGAATIGHFFGYKRGRKKSKLASQKLNPERTNSFTTTSEQVKNKSRKLKYGALVIVMLALFVIPFLISPAAQFGGTDNAASNIITGEGYTPWFNSLLTLSKSMEILLFSVQAAIGGTIIGYFFGNEQGKRAKEDSEQQIL
jgi:cobalt/nickel transport protein